MMMMHKWEEYAEAQPGCERLSSREQEIILLAAEGWTDKEIASRLKVAAATLKTHWERLRHKLHAKSRAHAVAKLLRHEFCLLLARLGLKRCTPESSDRVSQH